MDFSFYQFYVAYGGPNPNDLDFSESVDLDDIDDGSAELEILRQLARRASDSRRYVSLSVWDSREPVLAVEFPAGETSRHVFIHRRNCARFQGIPFGEYEFLTRYDAIWNKQLDVVEARVDCARGSLLWHLVNREPIDRVVVDPSSGAEFRLGRSSSAAQALLGNNPAPEVTLALAGAHITSADEAATKLASIGTAFLFQVSLAEGDLCSLVEIPSDGKRSATYTGRRGIYRWDIELEFPQERIDPKPLALYYYAGTLSEDFPLLKFLAYYQVVEYYFVKYSLLEAAQSASEMLCRSDFNPRDIGQVAQVIDHVLTKARRRGFGSELEQLLATIKACVKRENLRRLLTAHHYDGAALSEHLADSGRLLGMKPIEIGEEDEDDKNNDKKIDPLRKAVSARIYGIRNRIVHAKADSIDGQDPIFPFSRESMALKPDIEVLRYIAASALIKSSTIRDSVS